MAVAKLWDGSAWVRAIVGAKGDKGDPGIVIDEGSGAADGDILVYDGVGNVWTPQAISGYRHVGTQYYTSSGTFSKADPLGTGDIGLKAIRVICVGGGASGCGVIAQTVAGSGSAGGGGGGGGYAESFITDIASLSSSVSVTVGAGGVGVVGAAGNAGGTSSFGSSPSASGGATGAASTATNYVRTYTGGLGGNVLSGDFVVQGGDGGYGIIALSATRVSGQGGHGGASLLSGSARSFAQSQTTKINSSGENGYNYGGGGSGSVSARASSNSTAQSGGNGAAGIVIVQCFV